jgi:hypothetical protein
MKFKLFAMILALSLAAWAQENPSAATPNATPKPDTKSCCHHAANAGDATGAQGCCHHAQAKDATGAKSMAECCGKNKCEMKDGDTCCKGGEMAGAKSCCAGKDMKKCAKQCEKNGGCTQGKCCGATGEKSAMNGRGNRCKPVA